MDVMDIWNQLLQGFITAGTPVNLLWAFVGCALGTAVGVLPGIGPALTIALLLPLTYHVPATSMFVMFAGIYYGAAYGGSTTSILLNTPGESAAVVTALEGNKMARRGRAGQALATAAIGSFVAGTIGTIALTFFAPMVVDVALAFGPAARTIRYAAACSAAYLPNTGVVPSTTSTSSVTTDCPVALGLNARR